MSKEITTAKELYRLGIEETERERIARGAPPETEWVRQRAGLPELAQEDTERIKQKKGRLE